MKEMTAHQLLASIAHPDMPEGTAIIKLGNRWISMDIKHINVDANAGEVVAIYLKGHVK
jgi:hypothetical protein